jgi:hypothetical protein
MRKPKENDLADRRTAAADAKAALLDAHRVAKAAAEPTRLARQEERLEIATARNERRAERLQAKLDEQERIQADLDRDQAAADAAAEAQAAARDKALDDRVSRVVKDEAARKAERDRRYADRKARRK